MNPPRRRLLGLAASAAVLPLACSARAQAWPARPITVIVPASAGGPTDAISRVLADRLGAALGQTVLIENIGGASGTIGVGKLARSAPDGYTLCIGQWSHFVLNGATYTLQLDLLNDFQTVSLLTTGPMLVVTRKTLPANTFAELVAWLKANPDKASAGTGGIGAPGHISGLFFQKMTGTQFAFVPYRGTGPALRDLIAGQIDLMLDQASSVLPHIQAGSMKAFTVTAPVRLAAAPDVPTVAEVGLPELLVSVWHGVWAPKGLPADILAKVNAAVRTALADPATRAKLEALGQAIATVEQQTPQALAALQAAEIAKWWPIVKAAGIKAE
jgi:tripartite-type tricarboxylate transporter receptor subunit TctC